MLNSLEAVNSNLPPEELPLKMSLFTFWDQGNKSDIDRPLKEISESGISVVLVGAVGDRQLNILRAIHRNGMFNQSDLTWVFIDLIDSHVRTIYGSESESLYHPTSPLRGTFMLSAVELPEDHPSFQGFLKRWMTSFDDLPSNNQIQAYSCGIVLFHALLKYIEEAPIQDRQRVLEEMTQGRYARGPFSLTLLNKLELPSPPKGIMQFDENGDLLDGFDILNWGKFGPVSVIRKTNESVSVASDLFVYSGGHTEAPPDYRRLEGMINILVRVSITYFSYLISLTLF